VRSCACASGIHPTATYRRREVSGSVWTVLVAAGDSVDAGQALVVVESMKMEVTLSAVRAGRIERLLCAEGQSVTAGQALLVMH